MKPKLRYKQNSSHANWSGPWVGIWSISIARFLAKEFGLYGKDHKAQYKADMIVDCCSDFVVSVLMVEKATERKVEVEKNFMENFLPNFFKTLSKMLEENGGKCFNGEGISYADIFVGCLMDRIEISGKEEMIKMIPQSLKDLKATIVANPGVKKHLESRPQTSMWFFECIDAWPLIFWENKKSDLHFAL